ncbi:hypothetical protein HYW20_04375 [Candidatus Woesearchaeota archaeon]|nr:hypothetical protein [Candidatus Woesearchaeota archaeon]
MKLKADFGALTLIFIFFIVIGLLIFSLFDFLSSKTGQVEQSSSQMKRVSGMTLTAFDREVGRGMMDRNNDGRCDSCGMPVEMCLDSGQLECNMNPDSKIGILDSQHIHADFKVYVNEKPLNFADSRFYMKSSFVHIDNQQNKDDAGGALHIHATGVPLWVFFKSIGMEFNKNCITLENKEFCNNSNKKLKFFVNGKESNEFENYVFNDLDKILISYGDESEDEIKNQFNSITGFAELH